MMHIDTSKKQEQRKFGIVMAAAIAALGLLRWALHGFAATHVPVYFLAVAAVFLGLGLALPSVLKPIFIAWMKFALLLNWVITHLFLTIAFYGMITPVRLLIRIFSQDPLKRAWLHDAETYWEDAEEQPDDFEQLRNQF